MDMQTHQSTLAVSADIQARTGSGLPGFVKDEFWPFSSAASSRTASCACAAPVPPRSVTLTPGAPPDFQSGSIRAAVAPGFG